MAVASVVTSTKPTELAFSHIVPGSFREANFYRGKIVMLRPYNPNTRFASITLAPLGAEGGRTTNLDVRLKGPWAAQAMGNFMPGTNVALVMNFAEVVLKPQPESWQGYCVEYTLGLEGWILKDDDEHEWFSLIANSSVKSQRKPAAPSFDLDQPLSIPPVSPTIAEHSFASTPLLVAPAFAIAPPPQKETPTKRKSLEAEATVGIAGEGARSMKKKKKAERKVWGLTTGSKVYTALDKIDREKNNKGINLIAISVVAKAPYAVARSKTNDWCTNLRLLDPTHLDSFVMLNYFGSSEANVPAVEDGDVLVLHNINWQKDRGNFTAFKDSARFAVFNKADLLDDSFTIPLPVPSPRNRLAEWGQQEIAYARDLAEFMRQRDGPVVAQVDAEEPKDAWANSRALMKGGRAARQLVEIKDIVSGEFCDTIGEVVRMWDRNNTIGRMSENDSVALYITDYTANEDLFAYEDPAFGFGPRGQRVLQISVYGRQADTLKGIERGSIVHLRNLRPKTNEHDLLEATMVQDFKYSDKHDITVLSKTGSGYKAHFHALAQRRAVYWSEHAGNGTLPFSTTLESHGSGNGANSKFCITCDRLDLPTSEMSNAVSLQLPGIYHFRGRVVDYFPPRLEDWITAKCSACGECLDPGLERCLEHPTAAISLKYLFMLAVQDQPRGPATKPGEIQVLFDGATAAKILPLLPPTASMRSGQAADLDLLRARFASILGAIETQKRRKQTLTHAHAGAYFDFTVKGEKGKDGALSWTIGEGMRFNGSP